MSQRPAGMSVEDGNITIRQLIELREQLYGEQGSRDGISMLYRDPPIHPAAPWPSKAFTPGGPWRRCGRA